MADNFAQALNRQIANEFAAAQQYIAIAVHYDAQTLPQLAAFFYRQAVEERNHAMMMVQFLLDTDQEVAVPAIEAPERSFSDIVAPVSMALEQEKRVGDEITELFKLGRESGYFQGEQFLQWFLKEQVEEVASMNDLLNVVERSRENPLLAEEFLSREKIGDQGDDPTAPPAAGGAL
jgi:ferritin